VAAQTALPDTIVCPSDGVPEVPVAEWKVKVLAVATSIIQAVQEAADASVTVGWHCAPPEVTTPFQTSIASA
jgi:hypothetical protein